MFSCLPDAGRIKPLWQLMAHLFGLFCILITLPAHAAAWTQGDGFHGTHIQALAAAPDGAVYVSVYGFYSYNVGAAHGGIYKTTSGGQYWVAANNGLASQDVTALAVAPDGSLYAGLRKAGLFKSVDKGSNWFAINNNSLTANAFAFDGDANVYAGTSTGVFKSRDRGVTWAAINDGLTQTYVASLISLADGTLLAGTGNGLFRSGKGGGAWVAVTTIPLTTKNCAVDLCLVTEFPITPSPITASVPALLEVAGDGIYAGSWSDGLFKSSDNGATWVRINDNILPSNLHIQGLARGGDGTIYAATYSVLFKSGDGGKHWAIVNSGAPVTVPMLVAPNDDLYMSTEQTLVKGAAKATSWAVADRGLPNYILNTQIVLDTQGNLFAINSSGGDFYKSGDGGSNWTRKPPTNKIGSTDTRKILTDSKGVFYASVDGGDIGIGGGLYKSVDGGDSWNVLSHSPYTESPISSEGLIAIDRHDNLYATDNKVGFGEDFVYPFPSNLWKGGDGGLNWSLLGTFPANQVIVSLIDAPDGIFYAGTNQSGVYKSSDGGMSWVSINDGSTASQGVYTLMLDTAGNLYAGTAARGLFKRSNGSDRWVPVSGGLSGAGKVISMVLDGNGTLYALMSKQGPTSVQYGLYRSQDGDNWVAVDTAGLPPVLYTLATDRKGILSIGTSGGIFEYTPPAADAILARIEAQASGGITALQLRADISVAPSEVGKTGNLYLVANVPGAGLLALTGIGWQPVADLAALPPYITTTFGKHQLGMLDGSIDVSSLRGTSIYAGYGLNVDDLIANMKFRQIYTIQ